MVLFLSDGVCWVLTDRMVVPKCLAMLVNKHCDAHIVGSCRLDIYSELAEYLLVTLTFISLFDCYTHKSVTDSGVLSTVG